MYTSKCNIFRNISIYCVFSLLTTSVFLLPIASIAETTVPSYCELVIQAMEQQESNFQELIALADQYNDNPVAFATAEAAKQAEFEGNTNSLMASFDMTSQEYVLFMGKYKKEVETFWHENPIFKQQLDEISAEAFSLMTEFEELKGNMLPTTPLAIQ